MTFRWKRAVERLIATSGLARTAAALRSPRAAILAYHNIVPSGEAVVGDASLHVDQRVFAEQLDYLTSEAEVVPLHALISTKEEEAPRMGRRLRVAITFDDAYQGTMTVGIAELRSRGLPATVFVPPGLLGHAGFWWDLLADPRTGLAPAVRTHALEELQGRQVRILEWAEEESLPLASLPEHARPSDEAALDAGAAYEHVSLGAHTWSHPNLAALDWVEAREELESSRSWLRLRSPRYVDWVAYPYGLRPNESTVVGSMFMGGLLIDGGLAETRGRFAFPHHALPRINVPRGLTLHGLRLRLSGLIR